MIDGGCAAGGLFDPLAEPVVSVAGQLSRAGKNNVVCHHVAGGVVGELFGIGAGDSLMSGSEHEKNPVQAFPAWLQGLQGL